MAHTDTKSPPIKRIVTGHDGSGKTVVWMDGTVKNQKFPGPGMTASTLMWVTDETPADFNVDVDAGARIVGTTPPTGGTRFCIIDFQPGNEAHMHRTDTIDYVICMLGEIDMDMDDSTVHLKAGDIMIQRGTNHAWVNRGAELARLAFVLVDGKPKRAGSVSGSKRASSAE